MTSSAYASILWEYLLAALQAAEALASASNVTRETARAHHLGTASLMRTTPARLLNYLEAAVQARQPGQQGLHTQRRLELV